MAFNVVDKCSKHALPTNGGRKVDCNNGKALTANRATDKAVSKRMSDGLGKLRKRARL